MLTTQIGQIRFTALLAALLLAAPTVAAQQVVQIPNGGRTLSDRFADASESTVNGTGHWAVYTIPTEIVRAEISESFVFGNWDDDSTLRVHLDDTSSMRPTIRELLAGGTETVTTSATQPSTLVVLIHIDDQSGKPSRVVTSSLSTRWVSTEGRLHWLGNATQQESYTLLRSIVDGTSESRLVRSVIRCIGFHDLVAEASAWLRLRASSGSDLEVRKSAIYAIGYHPDAGNGAFLDSIARGEETITLRKAAAYSLSNRQPQESFNLLTAIAAEASLSSEVRKAAVFAVTNVPVAEVPVFLQSLAASSGNEDVSKSAVYALSDATGPNIGPLLVVFDEADRISVKKAVIFAIANTESSQAVSALKDIAGGMHERDLRKAAVFALGNVGTAEARDVLRSIVVN